MNRRNDISKELNNVNRLAVLAEKSGINVGMLEPDLPDLYRLELYEDPNKAIYMILLRYVPGEFA